MPPPDSTRAGGRMANSLALQKNTPSTARAVARTHATQATQTPYKWQHALHDTLVQPAARNEAGKRVWAACTNLCLLQLSKVKAGTATHLARAMPACKAYSCYSSRYRLKPSGTCSRHPNRGGCAAAPHRRTRTYPSQKGPGNRLEASVQAMMLHHTPSLTHPHPQVPS